MREQKRRKFILAAIAVVAVIVALVVPIWIGQTPSSDALSDTDNASEAIDHQAAAESAQQKAEAAKAAATGSQPSADETTGVLEVAQGDDGIAAEHEMGVVLVQIPDGATSEGLNDALARIACVRTATITNEDLEVGWARVELAADADMHDAVEQLEASGVVESAQPNYVYHPDNFTTENAEAHGEGTDTASVDLEAAIVANDVLGEGPLPFDDPAADSTTDAVIPEADLGISIAGGAESEAYNAYGNDAFRNQQDMVRYTHSDQAYKYYIEDLHKNEDAADRPAIAVLDTGCYLEHSDLKDNITHWYNALSGAVDSDDGKHFYDVDAEDSHGTHVCGIASARVNNGIGIQGTSGNCKLVPVIVFEYNSDGELSATSFTLLKAYQFVMSHVDDFHIKVVNMSLGANIDVDGLDEGDEAMFSVIGKAARECNVLTVTSAGNSGATGAYADFPSYISEAQIGVIALNPTTSEGDLGRASFSNYNKQGVKVEQLGAPGVSILSTNDGWQKYQRIVDGVYVSYSGTSMAAPGVAGIAALVWSVNPSLTVNQMKSVLFSTAQDIVTEADGGLIVNGYPKGFDLMTGFGCADALAAVQAADFYLEGETTIGPGLTCTLAPSSAATAKVQASEPAWSWTSSDPTVASVGQDGTVTGVKAGATVITATAGTDDDAIKLMQIVTVFTPSMNGADSVAKGDSTQFMVMQEDERGTSSSYSNGEWIWSSSDNAIATVDESGKVTGVQVGEATITATLATNAEISTSKRIQVLRIPLTSISLSASSFVYNGRQQRPSVTVRSAQGVVPASGYDLSWSADTTSVGTKTVTATGKGDYTETVSATYQIRPNWQAMYRLYNPYSGEHFYTANASERNSLVRVGWRYEGVGWNAPLSGSNVYRLYNPYAGDHHYTVSAAERDNLVRVGWRYEGVGWKSGGSTPLYRQYNPYADVGTHNYTTSKAENDNLVRIGWRPEGVGWYGV